ncbi:molybdenum ABC transporter ATP-binding protein [Microbulbifer taiwanensis]|uniref:molybdenum ABC transporter ATP-binding protein n=1 Tax=Microbulbifer taiwanensis TaxID=986746 RepID=UPI0036235091
MNTVLPGRGITAIFGRSGSGKTTLLRCFAGLQQADRARLVVGGETWQDEGLSLPTHKRPLGYVFQEASLFPHLSARGNLDYAIKRAGAECPGELIERVVSLMGIGPVLDRFPGQMSGGERQRVAIARALLIRPRLLLMDEPLASLDTARKQEILPYLERLRSEFDMPILYVSHSIDEVARLADHLLMLDGGRVAAQGDMPEMLSRLDLPLRLGEETGVVLEGRVLERNEQWHLARVGFAGGELWLRDGGDALDRQIRVRILARDVSLALEPQGKPVSSTGFRSRSPQLAPTVTKPWRWCACSAEPAISLRG